MNEYDALVVGAGPTGLACAIELQQRNLKTAVIEKGCIVNSLYHYPTHMTFFTTPELLEIGGIPMTSMYEKPTRTEALKYYRRVAEHYRLEVHQYERVDAIKGRDLAFQVDTTDRLGCRRQYRARKIVLATGYYDVPNLLNVPGESLEKVQHYWKEAHPYYAHDVLVVGGKNSAAIAALELHWSGARVTLVHRGPGLSDHVKYWIKPNLENRIKSGEIKAYFNTTVREIRPDSVLLATPEGELRIPNDFVLALTGYRPDLEFLASLGIALDSDTRRPRTNPQTLESERAGVHLAGVVVAGMHTNEVFIENGRHHGKLIAEAIAANLAG
ncbi:MAG: YpdA family putative bacillithiol disulfide reductase [Bryobacterales bacterium]|nr:YpdA family putative bacillithiol disulfide reductase [Bryobacterales bacterium]